MNNDAQDILGGGGLQTSTKSTLPNANLTNVNRKTAKKPVHVRRPAGVHRELYNLFVHQGKDNNKEKIESLVPTNTKRGYTVVKAQLGKRVVRKWLWRPFDNEARNDGLQLPHWEREDKIGQPYEFAKFNKQLDPVSFTTEEYEEYLNDSRWTIDETIHLLELCHRFDLRWPIIRDRFDGERFNKNKKSMEDMKERYYAIVNELNAIRGIQIEPLAYDADHERRRKEQLIKLWDRTEEQIKEENELKEAIKRIEAKRKDRERKAHDLQRLISAAERVSISPDSSTIGTPSQSGVGRPAKRLQKKIGTPSSIPNQVIPNEPHIRWPEFKHPGAHLRSEEMRYPKYLATKKTSNIERIVTALQIEYPPAFEEIVKLYNEFRCNILLLHELKTAVYNNEQTLDQLAHRLMIEKNINVRIEPRFRVSEIFYDEFEQDPTSLQIVPQSTDESAVYGKGKGKGKLQTPQQKLASVTSRRITKLIEINTAPLTQTRKRRTQTQVLLADSEGRSRRTLHINNPENK